MRKNVRILFTNKKRLAAWTVHAERSYDNIVKQTKHLVHTASSTEQDRNQDAHPEQTSEERSVDSVVFRTIGRWKVELLTLHTQ